MTQYFTDFSEYTADAQPSDWTSRWHAPTSWNVIDSAGATGGKLLRVSKSTLSRTAVTWNEVDADPNRATAEVLMRLSISSQVSSAYYLGPASRVAGAVGEETGYYGPLVTASFNGRNAIGKYDAGSPTEIAVQNAEWTAETFYWIRFQVSGTALRMRRWAGTVGDEPATWNLDTTDAAVSAAGAVGFIGVADTTYDVDLIGVGTDGDPAPSEAVSGPTTYTLSTSVVGEGSITLDPAGGTYDANTVVAATAVPATGWSFNSWSGDLTGATNPQNVTMDANKSITATFTEDAAPPATPTNLNLTPGDGQVFAEWSPSAGATGHRVYTNTVDNFGTATQVGADLGAAADSLLIESLTNGEQVWVYVTAFNAEGESSPASASATPTASPPPPPLPPGRAKLVLQRRVGGVWTP